MKGFIKTCLTLFVFFGIWNLFLGYFPFLLFLLFVVLFVFSVFISIKAMRRTEVFVAVHPQTTNRDENICFEFTRKTFTYIKCGQIVIDYCIVDSNQKCVYQDRINLYDESVVVKKNMRHSGYYQIHINHISCYDIIQCFSLKKECPQSVSFYVFPNIIHISVPLQETVGNHPEATDYSPYHKGEDYSEMFDLRAYKETDSLKHIHWKASLKKNELYVKEGSQPIIKKTLLAVDLTDNKDYNDKSLDCFYSLCLSLLEKYIDFEILCPQPQTSSLAPVLISSDQQFRECLKQIMQIHHYNLFEVLKECHDLVDVYVVKANEVEVYHQ